MQRIPMRPELTDRKTRWYLTAGARKFAEARQKETMRNEDNIRQLEPEKGSLKPKLDGQKNQKEQLMLDSLV